jgi:FkbM family methyltransferase
LPPFASIVSEIKNRYPDLSVARAELQSWLAKFRGCTGNALEALETLTMFLVLGLECGKRPDRLPPLLQAGLEHFERVTRPTLGRRYRETSSSLPEVFEFHHGLTRLPASVVETLKERDSLDIGAFDGDSALVLAEYSRCVYSFEIAPDNMEKFRRVLIANPEAAARIRAFHLGISDHIGSSHATGGGIGQALQEEGVPVNLTTIDRFVEENNLTIGLIKADVEGHALQVAQGGKETLIKQRPILSLASYHTFTELYNMSNWLMDTLTNYHFEWQMMHDCAPILHELHLIAYPLEMVAPLPMRTG